MRHLHSTVTFTNAKFADNSSSITLTGSISDGDSRPVISIADASAPEDIGKETPFDPNTVGDETDDDVMVFVVSLNKPTASTAEVSFDYETVEVPSSATPNVDFTALTRATRTIPAGNIRTRIEVPIIDDSDDTESNETFELLLTSANNAGFESGDAVRATGTIQEDTAREISFAQSAYEINESETTLDIVVNSSILAVHPIEFDL